MELRHLRYFVAVAAHGSFNRAAEILHLTQPPLSRQVKDLEEELGVPLLVRGANAVKLTAAGELFYEEAREVLARADEAVRRVRGEAGGETLRVGYAPSMTAGILPAALEKFQLTVPHARVELADLSSQELVDLANAGRLDVVIALEIALAGAAGVADFNWTELRRLRPVLVMPVSHPLAKLKRVPVERLRDLPLIGLGRASYAEYVPHVRRMLKPFGIAPRFATLVNDGFVSLFAEVEARRSVAIMSEGITCIMPPTLVAKPFAPSLPAVAVMVGVPALRTSRAAETFAQLLLDEARRAKQRPSAA